MYHSMTRRRLAASMMPLLSLLAVPRAYAQGPAYPGQNPALQQAAVAAVYNALDRIAIRQGNAWIVAFTVLQAAPNAEPPNNPFTPALRPTPAEPVQRQGIMRITTWRGADAFMLNRGPGTDWNAQVSDKIRDYSFYQNGGWTQPRLVLNFLQWTVAASDGQARVMVLPPAQSAQFGGSPDEGFREFIARVFNVDPANVSVSRPTG